MADAQGSQPAAPPRCRVYWGSHGCHHPRGHPAEIPHECDCCTCKSHPDADPDNLDCAASCVARPPYYGEGTKFYGEDAEALAPAAGARRERGVVVGWDGVPEHRGLRGGGEQPPDPRVLHQRRQEYLDRINRYRAATRRQEQQDAVPAVDASAPGGPQAASSADALGMPPDPFSGTLPGAIAQAEMLHSLIEGGMSEPQALYYMACLLQVGLAMRLGHLPENLPPWPPQST